MSAANTLLFLLLSTLGSTLAWADPQSKSYSSWNITEGNVSASFSIAAREITRMPAYAHNRDLGALWLQHLQEHVLLLTPDACELHRASAQRAGSGTLRATLHWRCPRSDTISVKIDTLMQLAPSHVHFATFHVDGHSAFERLFSRRQLQHSVQLNAPQLSENHSSTVLTYLLFGFEHILIGVDHIAFLLALMLLSRHVRDLLFIVSGFTLGHSITLSLTVLELVTPNAMMVEALIGFTIAITAVENISARAPKQNRAAIAVVCALAPLAVLTVFAGIGPPLLSLLGLMLFSWCYLNLSDSERRARQLRPIITTAFGLVHGFGFAAVLLEVGLPADSVIPALFGFNVGVELGQVSIVLALAGLGIAGRRLLQGRRAASDDLLSAALCGLGVYWFIQRLYF